MLVEGNAWLVHKADPHTKSPCTFALLVSLGGWLAVEMSGVADEKRMLADATKQRLKPLVVAKCNARKRVVPNWNGYTINKEQIRYLSAAKSVVNASQVST